MSSRCIYTKTNIVETYQCIPDPIRARIIKYSRTIAIKSTLTFARRRHCSGNYAASIRHGELSIVSGSESFVCEQVPPRAASYLKNLFLSVDPIVFLAKRIGRDWIFHAGWNSCANFFETTERERFVAFAKEMLPVLEFKKRKWRLEKRKNCFSKLISNWRNDF